MDQRIIFPNAEGGIAVIVPSGLLPVAETARKDVPQGTPYRIIDAADLPEDRTFRAAWEADFSTPDGLGDPQGWWSEQGQSA